MGKQEDIVSYIKSKVNPEQYDFSLAEGRRDFDNALRDQLRAVRDPSLRAHAGEMLKRWRLELFGMPDQHSWVEMERRLSALEAYLKLTPNKRRRQTEIKSLRPKETNR